MHMMDAHVTSNESSFQLDRASKRKVKDRLEVELEKLKSLTRLGYELSVVWSPTSAFNLSGEVKDGVIHIYEEDSAKALDILRHEFVDYLISLAIKPYERAASYYRAMVNALIERLGEEAYSEKEKVVEALKNVFSV